MSLFVISDTHLSLSTNKQMDCFNGWQNYVARLQKNWNSVVNPDDTVVVAGDISWAGNLKDTYNDFEFINRLNGKKIIIKGNHDYWWTTISKMNKYVADNSFSTISFLNNNSYSIEGISICGSRGWMLEQDDEYNKKIMNREVQRIKLSIDSAQTEEKIVFLHYPPITQNTMESDIINLLKEKNINRCYYGHLHGNAANYAYQGLYGGINFKLISADVLKFTPYLIKKNRPKPLVQ